MSCILVTRPKLNAVRLTDRLQKAGHEVIGEPLLDIVPNFTLSPCFTQTPLIIFTSPTTFSVLERRRAEVTDLLRARCYCVGDQTAAQARTFGFLEVINAKGDGQALADLILAKEELPPVHPILHIGGQDVSPQPAMALRDAGYEVVHWPVYEAQAVTHFSPLCREKLVRKEIDIALFTSVRTAQLFVKLIQDEALDPCCAGLTAVGLSHAVAKALEPLPLARIVIAPAPSEEGLWAVFSS
ncbi:MAG: uroporphyrinogen-III synthase [Alphaproteobacteria bacterium]|nr:uroporphyrinogen-III synthase [Alphaproteobacteria bacterium]